MTVGLLGYLPFFHIIGNARANTLFIRFSFLRGDHFIRKVKWCETSAKWLVLSAIKSLSTTCLPQQGWSPTISLLIPGCLPSSLTFCSQLKAQLRSNPGIWEMLGLGGGDLSPSDLLPGPLLLTILSSVYLQGDGHLAFFCILLPCPLFSCPTLLSLAPPRSLC